MNLYKIISPFDINERPCYRAGKLNPMNVRIPPYNIYPFSLLFLLVLYFTLKLLENQLLKG